MYNKRGAHADEPLSTELNPVRVRMATTPVYYLPLGAAATHRRPSDLVAPGVGLRRETLNVALRK